MPIKAVIGIDTSNYTTSCAICNTKGEILENFKILLPVNEGERGLRQSEAVFAHIKNLQSVSSLIREKQNNCDFVAIGYSAYPRDSEGSYMPCFLVGQAIAEMISALFNIPVYKFSHQNGHIQAAIYSSQASISRDFIAFHVSGGTTEVLHVFPNNNSYDIKIIGGCKDLHAGQAIDRIGVKMGFGFPCGKKMEQLALMCSEKVPKFKVSVSDYNCNLSGLENLANNLYKKTDNKELVSKFVISFISETIEKITSNLRREFNNIPIIYAGGVMSNSMIQKHIYTKFDNVYFAEPQFSTDNAAGTALLALKSYNYSIGENNDAL